MIGIAASAGGLAALSVVLSSIPADFPAAILVVQHLDPDHRSHLAEIMGRRTSINAKQASDGERIEAGTVYFGVPDRHLILNRDLTVSLTSSPASHYVRPAADLLFRSMAEACGARVIVVVLTGGGSDGAEGAKAVKEAGGTVIAQDESTSEFFSMPKAAIETGRVDHVLPLHSIAGVITDVLRKRQASSG